MLWVIVHMCFKFLGNLFTFGLCLQDSAAIFFDCNILAVCAVPHTLLRYCNSKGWLDYFVVLYGLVIVYLQNLDLKVYWLKVYCFVLQIDNGHWYSAALNTVVLSSDPAAVSAAATAASDFPASGNGCHSDCPGAAAWGFPSSGSSNSSNCLPGQLHASEQISLCIHLCICLHRQPIQRFPAGALHWQHKIAGANPAGRTCSL